MKEELLKRRRWVREKIEEATKNEESSEVLQYWVDIDTSIGFRLLKLMEEEK